MSDINTLSGNEVESGLATLKQRLEDLERRIQVCVTTFFPPYTRP